VLLFSRRSPGGAATWLYFTSFAVVCKGGIFTCPFYWSSLPPAA
jgi:hypothetical protein